MKLRVAGLMLWLAILFAGCRTVPLLPPADLSAPGWRLQQGQAVWKPGLSRPELAGDLLVATNTNGSALLQFIKDPFPLATAQTSSDGWQIDFGAGRRSWRGRGEPPGLFLWFQLPAALRGEPLQAPWQFFHTSESWRLENPRRGEWLEGRFFP